MMSNCKCKDIIKFDVLFGVSIFAIISFVMTNKLVLVYEQIEWYRALAVTLGSVTLAATIGVVSSLSAKWIFDNIILIIISVGALWAYSLTI